MALTLKSSAFEADKTIPKQYTCDGKDVSPPLKWQDAPAGTKSFAVIMDDPDAPPGTWIHWLIYDVPADTTEFPEGLAKEETLPSGAKQGLVWGVADFSRVGYFGPCPPPGKPHRYFFKLYALDQSLNLPPKATKSTLLNAMKGHILAEASLVGLYGR
jgi:Raf kinase inhibitor-like YbhB/YbcL family protein